MNFKKFVLKIVRVIISMNIDNDLIDKISYENILCKTLIWSKFLRMSMIKQMGLLESMMELDI